MAMIRFKRKNTAWIAALGVLTAVGLLAAGQMVAAPFVLQALLLTVFSLATLASVVEIGRERETIMDALKRAPVRQRVSPQAKEAADRAKSRGGFSDNSLMLLDIGLIALQSSYEGMALRRTRNISKDDAGVRPFITLHVDTPEADRHAVVRFEIYDQDGDQRFIHEMRTFLREGEMNIMTDHHLPLMGNREIQGTGDWDLRVYIDGNLVALQNMMLAPSIADRQRRLSGDYEDDHAVEAYHIVDEVEQEIPPRLQDLLQSEGSSSQQSATPSNTDSTSIRERAASRRRASSSRRRR